jgi:beta-lactamase class A
MELATQKSSHPIRKLIGLTVIIGTMVFIPYKAFSKRPPVISPIPETVQPESKGGGLLSIFTPKKNPDDLNKKVASIMDESLKDYSVLVEDYTSPFKLEISDTEIFTAASVNKVPILAALYYLAQDGTVDLDKVITLQADEIQDYGTGSIRYDAPGTTYSLKTLAKLMIKQSDNTAAYILANEVIGFDKLTELVKQWGLSQTDMVNNKTSNKDMAILFRKIYEEKITNHALTLEMLTFLKDTDFETRIPANLPKGTVVYHKIGSEIGNIHDAGIVTHDKHTYSIGVFTNGETDDEATEKIIAQVSKAVYDFLN